jgi:hypothetical protein
VPSTLEKLLKGQLAGHARVHLNAGELHRIGAGDLPHSQRTNVAKETDVSVIVEKLPVFSGSCGTMALGEIHDLKQAGMILLVTSSSGQYFHVELSGPGKQPAVTRVSSGAISKDLRRAIQRTATRSTTRRNNLELRVLRVAAMHVSAVWVHHPKRPSADVFVPYTPTFAGLRLGYTYKFHRIQSLLKKHATHMILRWYDRYEKSRTELKA